MLLGYIDRRTVLQNLESFVGMMSWRLRIGWLENLPCSQKKSCSESAASEARVETGSLGSCRSIQRWRDDDHSMRSMMLLVLKSCSDSWGLWNWIHWMWNCFALFVLASFLFLDWDTLLVWLKFDLSALLLYNKTIKLLFLNYPELKIVFFVFLILYLTIFRHAVWYK